MQDINASLTLQTKDEDLTDSRSVNKPLAAIMACAFQSFNATARGLSPSRRRARPQCKFPAQNGPSCEPATVRWQNPTHPLLVVGTARKRR